MFGPKRYTREFSIFAQMFERDSLSTGYKQS